MIYEDDVLKEQQKLKSFWTISCPWSEFLEGWVKQRLMVKDLCLKYQFSVCPFVFLQTLKQKFNACTSLLAWFASLALLWHFILSFRLAIMKYSLSFVLMVINTSALFLCLPPHNQIYAIAWMHSMFSFFLICQLLEIMIDAESRICFTCSVLKHACYEP